MRYMLIGLAAVTLGLTACGSGSSVASDPATATGVAVTEQAAARQPITLGISLFLAVDDAENPDPDVSTRRDITDIVAILKGVNEIWSQADVRFEPRFLGTLELPRPVLVALMRGDTRAFFDGLGRDFQITSASTVNVFFVPRFANVNGINPVGTRTAFIVDQPSVHDRRVTSHEIGHMLGLHHELADDGRLMFSGTNGMTLTEPEIATARYVASGILSGVR